MCHPICSENSYCSLSLPCLDSNKARIILVVAAIAFTILGLLSYHGKIGRATVSYFLGTGFLLVASILTALLAASCCPRGQTSSPVFDA